jgi:phosphatidylglycerol:prolipoprotein diacylglycerol transferase
MFPALHIGPLAIQTASLIVLLAAWLSIWASEREGARRGLTAGVIANLGICAALGGLLGARLGYALLNRSSYATDPLSVFSLTPSALEPAAGVGAALIVGTIYGQRKKLPLRGALDALAPGVAVLGSGLALADLASGDGYGAPARLPWSILLWGGSRHPSQVYELLGTLAVLALWYGASRRPLPPGIIFLVVVAASAFARLFLEAFRGDSQLAPGGLRWAQLWALLALALCFYLAHRWSQVSSRIDQEDVAQGSSAVTDVGQSARQEGGGG